MPFRRWMTLLFLCGALLYPCFSLALAQAEAPDKLSPKAFEAAVTFAQSLTQWAYIIIGASLLILVGTGYYRPKPPWVRHSYWLFVPGWFSLGKSIYAGTRVQEAYLAYLFLKNTVPVGTGQTMNRDFGSQICWMKVGLPFFGLWLLAYLSWWILARNVETPK